MSVSWGKQNELDRYPEWLIFPALHDELVRLVRSLHSALHILFAQFPSVTIVYVVLVSSASS